MGSPVLWGPNNTANNLQSAELLASGALINANGPKNYIANCTFENGLLGTAQQASLLIAATGQPSGTPSFGSGAGTNPYTLSLTTTNPLSGTTSLLMSTAGAQASATTGYALGPFTIDAEDKANVLQFKCSYSVVSGTWQLTGNPTFVSTTQSLAVAFWDATNSVWLSSSFNFVQSSGVGRHTSTVQTGYNTSSIYVVFYGPYQAQAAQSMSFDSFYLGPQIAVTGYAGSDMKSYAGVIGATTTAPTPGAGYTLTSFYRQEGDHAFIRWLYYQANAGSNGSGTYLFPLPSGLVIDTTKVTPSATSIGVPGNVVGIGNVTDTVASASLNAANAVVVAYNTTNLMVVVGAYSSATAGTEAAVSSAVLGLGNSTAYISFEAKVPIVGWSSNTVSSADTDTRVIAAMLQDTSGSSIAGGGTVQFATVLSDNTGSFSGGRFKVPVSGFYPVAANVYVTSANQTFFGIYKNGALAIVVAGSGSAGGPATGAGTLQCVAGDYIDVRNASGGAQTLTSAAGYNTLSINRLSGPAIVLADQSVNARYSTASAQAMANNAATQVVYGTKSFDTHNAYNASTGAYTVPLSGKYLIAVKLRLAYTSTNPGSTANIAILQNGTGVSTDIRDAQNSAAVSFGVSCAVTDVIQCLAGDVITVTCYQNNGSSRNLDSTAADNTFAITRVGN